MLGPRRTMRSSVARARTEIAATNHGSASSAPPVPAADCLDRIESDTSSPYFRKQNNDRFVTTRAGLFRLNFFTINNSCGWAHSGAFVQGRWVTMTHLHTWQSWWKDVYNDVEFRAQNGHYFGIRTHAACGHTSSYHYSSHGRIEAEYIGTWT